MALAGFGAARRRALLSNASTSPVSPASAAGQGYGYARVSTLRQADEADEGEALETQQRQIAGYAQRPGDAVITPKLDRMFRSALDDLAVLGKLKADGISLHMIDLGGDTTGKAGVHHPLRGGGGGA
jgi:DNA invertase Pin-like site-specific DNA recombinase